MKFVCFGGAAAVADDAGNDEAVIARGRSRRRARSFRGKFLSGNKAKKKSSSSSSSVLAEAKRSPGREADIDVYDMIVGAGKSSSVPSSSGLSSSASLDSACTSSSCSSSLSSSSSSSFLEAVPPSVKRPEKRSPEASAAAVVVCLVMLLLCGRVGATLLTSTALYFLPRHWPARANAGSTVEDGAASTEYGASAREEEAMKRMSAALCESLNL